MVLRHFEWSHCVFLLVATSFEEPPVDTNNFQRTAQMVFPNHFRCRPVEVYVSPRRTAFSLGVKKATSSLSGRDLLFKSWGFERNKSKPERCLLTHLSITTSQFLSFLFTVVTFCCVHLTVICVYRHNVISKRTLFVEGRLLLSLWSIAPQV